MKTWRYRMWIAWCAGFAALAGCSGEAGCSGPQLVLGGGGDSGCVPGTYAGAYDCDASYVFAPGQGDLVFKLQGDFHGKALHIAPGSKLGMDTMGFTSAADLSGTLDCTTNRLVGTVSNVTFSSSTFNATLTLSGDLSADYDASAVQQALVNGQIAFTAADAGPFPFPDAAFAIPEGGALVFPDAAFAIPISALGPTSCSWSATLQP